MFHELASSIMRFLAFNKKNIFLKAVISNIKKKKL
jgi:hypothetical protein